MFWYTQTAIDAETTKLALEPMRDIQAVLDAMKEGMREIKRCLTSIEASAEGMAAVLRQYR